MRALGLVLLFSLAGCERPTNDSNPGLTANEIERISTPKEDRPDPQASVRLQPIMPEDLARAQMIGVGCSFSRDGRIYLAAVGNRAIIHITGEIRQLAQSAPVAASGGFFEDREVSISIGRADGANDESDAPGSWPARIAVTNRRTEVQLRQVGVWTCGG